MLMSHSWTPELLRIVRFNWPEAFFNCRRCTIPCFSRDSDDGLPFGGLAIDGIWMVRALLGWSSGYSVMNVGIDVSRFYGVRIDRVLL